MVAGGTSGAYMHAVRQVLTRLLLRAAAIALAVLSLAVPSQTLSTELS
jgi:hypothetical protein